MPTGPFGFPRPFAQKETQPSEIDFDVHISNENIRELYDILIEYDTLKRTTFGNNHTYIDLIIMAFKLEKPVTVIDLYGDQDATLKRLEEDLSDFFFTYRDSPSLYISRFKTPIEVIENQDGLSDSNADLTGILFGFSPENTAGYIKRSSAIDHLFKEVK